MKKLQKVIALSFLIFGTLSCSDDDNPWDDFASIIGEWEFVSSTSDGEPDEPEDCTYIVEFINDSEIEVTEFYGDGCVEEDIYSIDYTQEGDKLTTSEDGDEYEYVSTILTLTETTLVVQDVDEGEIYVHTFKRL